MIKPCVNSSYFFLVGPFKCVSQISSKVLKRSYFECREGRKRLLLNFGGETWASCKFVPKFVRSSYLFALFAELMTYTCTYCSSHLVTVPPGPMLSDALVSSPIIVGEDGTGAVPSGMGGFEFGVDPNEDPELALVSRPLNYRYRLFQ